MNHKKSYLLFVGNALYAVLSFLSIAILSHLLNPNDYGALRYTLSISAVFTAFISMGFAQAIYYYLNYSKDSIHQYQYINANRFILILLGLLSILLLFALGSVSSSFKQLGNNHQLMFALLLFTFISGVQSCDLNVLLVLNKALFYFINTLSLFVLRILLFFYIYYTYNELQYYIYAMCLTSLLGFGMNQLFIEVQFPHRIFTWSKLAMKNLWKYSWPIGIGLAFGIILTQADRILIMQLFKDPKDIALISNGNFEVPLITVFYTSFSTVALPLMMSAFQNNNTKEVLNLRFQYQAKVASMLFPLVFVFIAWSSPIIRTVFGEYYLQSATFFSIYSITFFFRFTSYHDVFLLSNKTKYIGIIQAIELLFHIVLTYVLVLSFGLIGASIAAVMTNFLYVLASSIISARILNVPILKLYPYKKLSLVFVKSFLFILPFFIVSSMFDSIFVQLGLAACACLFTFAMLNGFKFNPSSKV